MRVLSRHTPVLRVSIAKPSLLSISRTPIAVTRSIKSYTKSPTPDKSFVTKQIAKMSSASTQSQACCNTPAVVSKGYTPKGDYIEVDGLKTCQFPPIPIPHLT